MKLRAGWGALALLVAACGSAPKGGYYKDDGPGAHAPSASIPDAVSRLEPLHRFANRPYEVFGRSYVPHASLKSFRQQGLASWYGKRFHGSKTSSGEIYDMYKMTAAHPTLAIPSYARVTNLANGRSVVVRVNDRGPFHGGRIIDLSYAAATKLGYVQAGSARVEVEAIVP
jgi:rare lipoprotein A